MTGHPLLFQTEGTATLPDRPALCGGRCGACGLVFFPMQYFGCERCGDVASLLPVPLNGRGRLLNAVKVHWHAGPGRSAPFWVGSILTEDGAFVRAVLDVDDDRQPAGGCIVTARLVQRCDDGGTDLHFATESETSYG